MEPEKYNNSCIYKIWKDTFIYIGSTSNFKRRMSEHKSACNNINSKIHHLKIYQTIRLHGGWDKFEKLVVQNVCCENRKELYEIEGMFIKNIATMNCVIAGRSQKKYHEDNRAKLVENMKKYRKNNKDKISENGKKYYENNKDNILENVKKYYEKNKEKIKERKKIYREKNKEKISENGKKYYEKKKEKIKERKKIYREKNKEKIKEKRKIYYEKKKEKIICSCCGILVRKGNYTRHQKTKKCMKFQ